MEGNLLNYNSKYDYHKKIKIKKKLLDFPSYISDEELKYKKKKINKNLMTIENNHNYFFNSNIFNNNKDQIPADYITDLNNINNSQSLRTSKKLTNKKLFSTSVNSKKTKNIIKCEPSFLKDSKNPYKEYNANIFDISNDKYLSKKHKKKNLTNANFSNASGIKNKNKNENIFLTSYKGNFREVNKNNSPKLFLDKNSKSNLTLNESNNYFHKYNSNIIFYNNKSGKINARNKTIDNFNINYRNNSNNYIVKDFNEINITDNNDYNNSNNKNYKNESNIIISKTNDTEGFKLDKMKPSSQILILSEENEPNNNKRKDFFTERNLSYKTRNSKRYFISSKNHIFNRNSNELNNNYKNYKRILTSEKSKDKIRKQNRKKLLNEIADINEELKTIQNDLINQQEDDSYLKLEELIKKSQSDNIVTNILIEKGRIKFESIKELFKKMKQKNFLSELKLQYFKYKKGNESSYKKRFLKELKKIDLIEKKEAFLRDLAYKMNYDIRRGVNRLKEKDLSKEREIFNRKTDKIGKMNINNIKNFIKNMNKFK